MVRPQSRVYNTPLVEYQPILLRIDAPVEEVKDSRDPEKTNVIIHFTVLSAPWGQSDPPHKEKQQHSNTVNPKGDGTPSLLAQLINAASAADLSKAEMLDTEIDTFLPGKIVEAVGEIKQTDRGKFWNVRTYRRPSQATPTPVNAAAPPPAITVTHDDDGYTISEDGKHRWKPGMASWEPIPAPEPVPPPRPVAAPPPQPTPSPVPAGPPPQPSPGTQQTTATAPPSQPPAEPERKLKF